MSGQSRAAFARQQGLRPRQFAWWVRRLAEERQPFVEVSVDAGSTEAEIEAGVSILVAGVEVRLSAGFDEETARRALALFEERQ